MQSLTDYVNNSKYRLRNIEYEEDIFEKLKDINGKYHFNLRKVGKQDYSRPGYSDNIGNISEDDIRNMFEYCNNIIVNSLLNKEVVPKKSELGILYKDKDNFHTMIIFKIDRFDKEKFEYDIFVKTVNKRRKVYRIFDVVYYVEVIGRNKRKIYPK